MTNLARHRALLELERSHDGSIPPWEREAAIRGARTERENLEHDLKRARWNLEDRSDTLRAYAREVMFRHKAMHQPQPTPDWNKAFRLWRLGRKDLRFYLDAFKASRDLVRELESRLAALECDGPTNGGEAP